MDATCSFVNEVHRPADKRGDSVPRSFVDLETRKSSNHNCVIQRAVVIDDNWHFSDCFSDVIGINCWPTLQILSTIYRRRVKGLFYVSLPFSFVRPCTEDSCPSTDIAG